MTITGSNLSRRSLLKSAAPAIAGGLAAIGAIRPAAAAPFGPAPEAASLERGKIWSGEYWAHRGDLKLYMYRKRVGAPKLGKETRPVLFLTHGSSVSSRSTFDLTVPGHGEYSLMDVFARYGFDVWTMDFAGYGRSSWPKDNSNIADGVLDLTAGTEVMARETGQERFNYYGESSGALRAGAFAMAHPERMNRLCLVSFTYTGKGSPTLGKRAEMAPYLRAHNRRPRDRKMIDSIFTRDKPGTSDPAVAKALADTELKYGDTCPTGTYLDMVTKLPIVDPLKVLCPVLIMRGQYDGIAALPDVLDFYEKLPNFDRWFVIIPGASHAVALGTNRRLLWHAMHSFLDEPRRLDAPKQD
ncbi:MAG TPA: alpha/beta hydrolase [Terriglobia bacterium]|nr:alpha/beta hydrolase [Terriglobia bacterium]